MNALLLDQFSELGGAQLVSLDTLSAIRDRGWNARVGLPGNGELFERVGALGFETERIDCGPYHSRRKSLGDMARFGLEAPRLASQIRAIAARTRPDLVYLNGPRIAPAVALARLRRPTLFHSHSFLPEGPVRKATAFALRRLRARVAAASDFVAGPWREALGDDRVEVIYNGVAPPAMRRESFEGLRAGFIGRIAPEKGVREFVEVARQVCAARPEARFIVYGAALFSGEAYEREARASAEGLPVEFAGWAPDIGAALARISVLLVPSFAQEAMTRVIPEAFAAGVPVVAFASGGIPEAIEHGVNGMLVKSVDEMAEAVLALEPGQFAEAARRTWEKRFTLERYKCEIAACMERALRSARG